MLDRLTEVHGPPARLSYGSSRQHFIVYKTTQIDCVLSDNDERDANQLGAGKSAGKRISLWIDFIIGGNFESEDCIGDSSVK